MVTIVVLVMLGYGVAQATAALSGGDEAAQPAPLSSTSQAARSTSGSSSTSGTTRSTGPTSTSVSSTTTAPTTTPVAVVPPLAPELAAARDFMLAWCTHPAGMTSEQWVKQLEPYVQPEALSTLRTIDPRNISSTAVKGDPVLASTTGTVAQVDVQTDTDKIRVVVLKIAEGTWRVRSYDKAPS